LAHEPFLRGNPKWSVGCAVSFVPVATLDDFKKHSARKWARIELEKGTGCILVIKDVACFQAC